MGTFKVLVPKIRQLSIKYFLILIPIFGIIILIILSVLLNLSSEKNQKKATTTTKSHSSAQKSCRDWNNYEQIYREMIRKGLGENGTEVILTDENEIALNRKLFNETGFGVVVSDRISVNRSIQDTRHPDCQKYLYPSELPSVSIIIIFYNEVFSVLKRTLHSIVNRTPPELLHEIILVNDKSSNEELYDPLKYYIAKNFPKTTIRIKNLKERKGLIVTRLEGAEIATGEVLVFFE